MSADDFNMCPCPLSRPSVYPVSNLAVIKQAAIYSWAMGANQN